MENLTHVYEQNLPIWEDDHLSVKKVSHTVSTDQRVPKLGVMLVGLGGNNGSTFTAGIIANKKKVSWESRVGTQEANFYGSFTQSATTHVGYNFNHRTQKLQDVFKPIKDLVPMVNPVDFQISGWDISGQDLYQSCKRAKVLEPSLIESLKSDLENIRPLSSVLNPEFIAANQSDRVDNVFKGTNRQCIDKIRKDIQDMKTKVDKVVVLWTANTEMFMNPEIETVEQLHSLIENNASMAASVLFCVACIEEQVLYLNGSPQNTFHQAVVDYAKQHGSLLAGSDFKSGQTRFKTVLSDYLIGSGIRISSVVSYNHLGNNDGKNLAEDKCFQSKKISKRGVLDDAIESNPILYPKGHENIDHEVVIKYVPFVGDSKRALDEYSSQIFMNGVNTISSYNICEDSLLAVPLMIDMVVLGELFSRVEINGKKFGPVLSYLSFFFKAPITNHKEFVINSFYRQRESLVNVLKVLAGMQPDDNTMLAFNF